MNIYIMSRGRAGRTITQKWIPESLRSQVVFVVPNDEVEAYGRALGHKFRIWPAGVGVNNYSSKFQWIMDGLPSGGVRQDPYDKALIMDDDLVFASRSDPERPNSLISISDPEATLALWPAIETLLDEFALVSVHPRAQGQLAERPYTVNGRIICIQGINRTVTEGIKVDQFPILADVVLNATLLSRGHANARITTFFQNWGPVNAPGGCGVYRTADMQRKAIEYIAARFPGCFKVTTPKKLTPNSGTEYIGYWKKLYELGIKWRDGAGPSPDREHQGAAPVLDPGAL